MITGKYFTISTPQPNGKLEVHYDDSVPFDGSWAWFEVDAKELYEKLKRYYRE